MSMFDKKSTCMLHSKYFLTLDSHINSHTLPDFQKWYLCYFLQTCVGYYLTFKFNLSQGLPGQDGPAGEKGESVSAAKLLFSSDKVLSEAFFVISFFADEVLLALFGIALHDLIKVLFELHANHAFLKLFLSQSQML